MLPSSSTRFCIVGPGRLGSTLLANLLGAGFAVPAVVRRPELTPDRTAVPPALSLTEASGLADVLWLTVPDDAIAGVAAEAADTLPSPPDRPRLAIHSSGLGSLRLLAPLQRAGLVTIALHPLQTFGAQSGGAEALTGVPVAVTAAGDEGRRFGAALVEKLGGRPFCLDDDARPLYHLAATVACNLLVALQSEAGDLMATATGRSRDEATALLTPIAATTVANVGAHGAARALTGPVARGDVGTVRAHLDLLDERTPRFAATYRALSLQALTLAAPRLDDEAVRTLRSLLEPRSTPS